MEYLMPIDCYVVAVASYLLLPLWVVHENICDNKLLIIWRKFNTVPRFTDDPLYILCDWFDLFKYLLLHWCKSTTRYLPHTASTA